MQPGILTEIEWVISQGDFNYSLKHYTENIKVSS